MINDSVIARQIVHDQLLSQGLNMAFSEFCEYTSEWEFKLVGPAGVVMIRDHEIHYARLPTHNGRSLTKRLIKQELEPILNEYGFVTTKVTANNREGNSFVKRLGFRKVDKQENINHYILEESRYV